MPRRMLVAIIGVVLVLGWLTVKDRKKGSDAPPPNDKIPSVVFGGGAATLTIEATASEPAKVSAVFETGYQVDDSKHKLLETWQMVEAGTHTFTIDVPAGVSGRVEVGIDHPSVGATVELICRVNDELIHRDTAQLDQPLQEGTAFFTQIEFDDFATGELTSD